jgi:hypothetical protein
MDDSAAQLNSMLHLSELDLFVSMHSKNYRMDEEGGARGPFWIGMTGVAYNARALR